MRFKKLKTVYKKEILDVLRDKKTVFTMIVLPILLYPTLFFIIMQVMSFIKNDQETMVYQIAFTQEAKEQQEALMNWITKGEDGYEYEFAVVDTKEPEKLLDEEKIDAYLEMEKQNSQLIFKISYLSAVTNSQTAANYLQDEIESYRVHCAEKKISKEGMDVNAYLYPVTSVTKDMSSTESSIGNILGGFIPFLLIVSIVMATMYPAIDTTAGEKERGTLETMMTLPVGNRELIMGKFLSVATIAIVSVFMNFISMGAIVAYMIATMSEVNEAVADFSISSFVPAMLIVILCVIAFALFMSAVVMCVCAFAKSFKEANNYITPISLVVLLVSYIGFIPNIELTRTTAMIPVANISLLVKNLLVFKYDFSLIALVLLSNIAYALIAISILSKIYNSESLLFGDSALGLKLFEKRKNLKKGGVPSIQEGIFVIVVVLLIIVYIGGLVALKTPILSVIIPQACIIGIPLFACWYIKGNGKEIFSLRKPKARGIAGALVMFVAMVSIGLIMSTLIERYFPTATQGVSDSYGNVLENLPFGVALFLIAGLPAICEEMMYRGYLMSAFSSKMKPWKAMIIVSFIFAASHMSMVKMLPTFVMGLALAYTAYQTGSLMCSSLMHFLNNGLYVAIAYYGADITWLQEKSIGNMELIILGILAILCGGIGIIILRDRSFYAKID